MHRPTLKDVAREAQCSVTTVSRVINHYGYLSEKTITAVHAAMKKLNYQPNSLARSLQGKRTHLIGVIVPSITNPFFAELVEEIENELLRNNYKMILCNSVTNKEKERAYLRMLIANQVDGVIAGAHNLGIGEYQRTGLPIVSFDRQLAPHIPIVSSDNYQGMVHATRAMYRTGARHIYFLGNPHDEANPTIQRLRGYQDTVHSLGLQPHICPVRFDDSPAVKKIAIKDMLTNHHPDAVVCTDDLTALLVLQTAQELHINVPTDLRVSGFDGTKLIQNYCPELPTVVQPTRDIAAVLVNFLKQRIETPDKPVTESPCILPVTFRAGNLAN